MSVETGIPWPFDVYPFENPALNTPPVIEYRCKICLNDYSDVAKYGKHIDSFKTLNSYADHVSDRPKKGPPECERPEERQVT